MICDYCKKKIRKCKIDCHIHENICQTNPKLVFCRQSCKLQWCRDVQKGIIKEVLSWSIKKKKNKFLFVKKHEHSDPISNDASKMSYFSKNLYYQNK
ncbi:MAG: hypothetical protein ACFFBP_00820 [Promethearchaeota archaeon]